MSSVLDQRPIVVALAGPNGAGKTTFYQAHLAPAGLRFVNADVLARELGTDPYSAARLADAVRRELVRQRESFVFETVFSDPVGDKLAFLKETARAGYTVVLCFVGLSGPERYPMSAWPCAYRRAATTCPRRNLSHATPAPWSISGRRCARFRMCWYTITTT